MLKILAFWLELIKQNQKTEIPPTPRIETSSILPLSYVSSPSPGLWSTSVTYVGPLYRTQNNIFYYRYSTNVRAAQIWSKCDCYLSSVHDRYPAIYVGCQVRLKSWKCSTAPVFSSYNMYFVDNLLNNKTIILLNLAEYCLILANLAYNLVW